MSVIIMILLLGFLILIHELGHFVAARMLGIRVSKFALGFPIGPTLWSKKIGDVEYLIHACLIGGYVSFPDDDKDSDIPLDSIERFQNNPAWKRMIVISAGVIMNLIIAFVLVFLVAWHWGELPAGDANIYVGKIEAPKEASVWQSGMEVGDRILTINGSVVTTPNAVTVYAKNNAQYDGKIDKDTLENNLKKLEKLNPSLSPETPIEATVVVKLPQNLEESAVKIDDDILKGLAYYKDEQLELSPEQVNLRDSLIGQETYIADGNITLKDVAYAISDNFRPLNIVVLRNGKEIKLDKIYPDKKGVIGIKQSIEYLSVKTDTPAKIFKEGSVYLWKQTALQIYGMGQLIKGKIPAKEMHGIVAVAKIGGDVIQKGGFATGLLLTAIISAWLAILNFLPIPALDGGHMMFMIIEKLRGKPVSEKTIEKLSTVFFALIIILAFLLVGNDIYALITHKI